MVLAGQVVFFVALLFPSVVMAAQQDESKEIISCLSRQKGWVVSDASLPGGWNGAKDSPVQRITIQDGQVWVATLGFDYTEAQLERKFDKVFQLSHVVYIYAPPGFRDGGDLEKVRDYESGKYMVAVTAIGACSSEGRVWLDIYNNSKYAGSGPVGRILLVPGS